MPDMEFTKAQSAAILHQSGDLLVSAGAGSGKTRALTEKVARYLIAHPDKDATSLLIVTFTNAAAAELRERIGKRLSDEIASSKDRHALYRQIASLERAPISTIHAFCLSVLRPRAASLGLSPDFSVADVGVAAALRAAAMSDTVDQCFETADDAPDGTATFREVVGLFGSSKNVSKIENVLLDFADLLRNKSSDPAALRAMAARREEEAASGVSVPDDGVLCSLAAPFGSYYGALFSRLIGEMAASPVLLQNYVPVAREHADFCERLEAAASRGDLETVSHLCEAVKLPTLRGKAAGAENETEASLYFKSARSEFSDKLKDLAALFVSEPAEVSADALRIARFERAIADITERFEARYTAAKQDRGLIDFGDLEMLTHRLLVSERGEPTPIALSIAASYDRIFVDEYQDTNHVQDEIFRVLAVARNRFLVGDIKQSIYGFRGAEPSLFAGYRRAFPPLDPTLPEDTFTGDASVFMSDNFRSDKPIIDFTNLVSDTLFPSGGIGYTADDRLICGKNNSGTIPVEIAVCPKPDDGTSAEAAYVARRIRDLLRSGRKNDGTPILPSDIAILLRSVEKDAPAFREALEAAGIPVSASTGDGFFREPEILLARALLSAIDNPTRDVPLASCLKSRIYGFSMDDLVRLRQKTPQGALWDALVAGQEHEDSDLAEKCRYAADRLTRYRRMSRGMPSDKLIEAVWRDTAIAVRETEPGEPGADARVRLQTLYDMARQYESTGFGGLFGFLRHLDRLTSSVGKQKIGAITRGGAVQIITVHSSKGLEYPVVFLSSADRAFNMKDVSKQLLFEPDVGISMKLTDETGLLVYDTRQRKCAARRIIRRSKEESMRVLYVALTRARERLIITGKDKDPAGLLRKTAETLRFADACGTIPPYLVGKATSFLDWIMLTAAAHPDDLSFRIILPEEDTPAEEAAEAPREEAIAAPIDGELAARLEERFDFRYPYEDIAKLPAKLIVSRLHPGIIDPDEPEDEVYTATGKFLAASDLRPEPSFLSGMPAHTAADVGIATHAFFEFCRLDELAAEGGIGREMTRLVAEGFITEKMADLVNRKQIEAFRASRLYARMRSARAIKKEFRFYAAVPADTLTTDAALAEKLRAEGATVLVQGVVDCFFEDEDGRIVLVDYKTDRLTAAELADRSLAEAKLRERHTDQLTYYRHAVEKMLGRPVDEVVVYSLPLGDTVAIL